MVAVLGLGWTASGHGCTREAGMRDCQKARRKGGKVLLVIVDHGL